MMSTMSFDGGYELDDIAALRRFAASGDPRGFEVVASRYRGMVLATCRRVLGTEADAEDAAQETFLKLARSAKTIKANAGAWLHACAVRTSIDQLRRHVLCGTQIGLAE